ncbi:MAG: hypothetical protein LBG07_01255 [Treponema sp.]|jgi:hypothetical protein|nr:hypothetical protein [Treponema sp.]
MNSIIDLRETSPDHWQAKYQGNYGVYTVKITTDGKHRGAFSCSCPSDYYPCKHIPIVEEAIMERIAKNAGRRKDRKGPKISAEELLKKLTREELYDFMVKIVKNNPDLINTVFLEFAEKIEDDGGNKYVSIIRRGLANIELDESDYYSEYGFDIGVLDEWAEKAERFLKEKTPREAVLIAQAYIEEFARWLQEDADSDLIDQVDEMYQSRPFEILEKAAASQGLSNEKRVDVKALYDYCMAEAPKKKYAGYMADCFNDLLMDLSIEVNPEAFIALQHSQLSKVQDKSSYEAEKILNRIVGFYKKRHNFKKAWQYVEENIQINGFRRMVVEKKIEQKKFTEAKKLIHDYIDTQKNKYRSDAWDDYLLQIAQEEKDISAIRGISYSFIKDNFNEKYYRINKSAFNDGEWAEEFENLFRHYESKKGMWDNPAMELLVAGKKADRLIEHIEKKLSLENMEKYYTFFAGTFPEKTLDLFRKALDRYAAIYTGRGYYEHIKETFRKIKKIPGGDAVVADMKAQYRIKYKNRRAMMEILGL